MKWKAILIPALAGLTICACASTVLKVPVFGDVKALAGRWDGEFVSDDAKRSGTIMFDLRAGTDTAFGDVLVVPRDWQNVHTPWTERAGKEHHHPELLAIQFVRISGNMVRGTLEKYRDPLTGCDMRTVFDGVLSADVISGRYVTYNLDTRESWEGKWTVRRSALYTDTGVHRDNAVGKAE